MIDIKIEITNTDNPNSLINGITDERFVDIEELNYWLREVFTSDLSYTLKFEKGIIKPTEL